MFGLKRPPLGMKIQFITQPMSVQKKCGEPFSEWECDPAETAPPPITTAPIPGGIYYGNKCKWEYDNYITERKFSEPLDCYELCKNIPECNWFTLDSSGTCYMTKRCTLEKDNGYNAYHQPTVETSLNTIFEDEGKVSKKCQWGNGEIAQIADPDPLACYRECKNNPDCKWYYISPGNHNCYLNNNCIIEDYPYPDFTLYEQSPVDKDITDLLKPFTNTFPPTQKPSTKPPLNTYNAITENSKCNGKRLNYTKTTDPWTCLTECEKYPECQWFYTNPNTGYCYLYDDSCKSKKETGSTLYNREQMERLNNTFDYGGYKNQKCKWGVGDLTSVVGADPINCYDECQKNPDCKWFYSSPLNNICYLNSECEIEDYHDAFNFTLHNKEYTTTTIDNLTQEYKIFDKNTTKNQTCEGNGIASINSTSISNCIKQCEITPDCTWVSIDYDHCTLYDNTCKKTKKSGSMLYDTPKILGELYDLYI